MRFLFFLYWLPALAGAFTLQPQLGHTADITAIVYSPDGNYLASASKDKTIRLWELSTGKEIRTFQGHTGKIYGLAYSRDGKYLASSSDDLTVRLWEVVSGKELKLFEGHTEPVWTVAFSPDGKRLASASGKTSVNLKVFGSEERADQLEGQIRAQVIKTGGSDTTIKVWDVSGGAPLLTLEGHKNSVWTVTFSPDGKRILSGDAEGVIKVWDADNGSALFSVEARENPKVNPIFSLAYSPTGKYFASGIGNVARGSGAVALWDAASGKKICEVEHPQLVGALAYRGDGLQLAFTGIISAELLASIGAPTTNLFDIGFIDVASCKLSGTISKGGFKGAVSYSPNGKLLAAAEKKDRAITLWDVSSGEEAQTLQGSVQKITSAVYSQDGSRFFVMTSDYDVKVWDASSLKELTSYQVRPDQEAKDQNEAANTSAAVNLASIFKLNGDYAVWPKPEGAAVKNLSTGEEKLLGIDWSAFRHSTVTSDGAYLFASDNKIVGDDRLTAWDSSGAQVGSFTSARRLVYYGNMTALQATKQYLAVAVGKGRWRSLFPKRFYIELHEVSKGRCCKKERKLRWGHTGEITTMAFSQDEKYLLSGSNDDTAILWDLQKGRDLYTFTGHTGNVTAVAFRPDGKWVATGSQDKTIKLWDASSGEELKTFTGHTDRVTSVSFSPDGKLLLSTSDDGTLRLWKLDDGASVSMASSRAGDWIVYDERGYFDSSARGAELVSIIDGASVFNVDQFAIRNNRPDILLEKMGLGSVDERDYFRFKHEKRLAKANLKENELEVSFQTLPKSKILEATASEKEAALTFELQDPKGLRFYQMYINGVPVYGGFGKETSGTSQRLSVTLPLSSGKNRIELSAINTRGQESLRSLVVVTPKEKRAGALFFVGFGVSDYEDPDIPDLAFAHKDVQDLASSLSLLGYESFSQKIYTNQDVSLASLKAAKEFLKTTQPQDTVVLFIAGHGLHDQDAEATYYYLGHSAKLSNLSATAISFEMIEDLLAGIPAQRKLFLMDTCESGEVEEEAEGQEKSATQNKLDARAIVLSKKAEKTTPPKRRPWLLERDRFIYQDLSRRTGAIVFSSSQGKEFSYESTEKQNGLFTFALINALSGKADTNQDRLVTVDELRRYVSREVNTMSTIEGGKILQHPTIDRDNLYAGFAFLLR